MENISKFKYTSLIPTYKKRLIGICVLVSTMTSAWTQSEVNTSGGDGTGPGGSVAYTIGQVAYTNLQAENGSISLGVQQPNLFLTVGTIETEITLSASVFPNPSNANTTLRLEGQDQTLISKDMMYRLFDLNGKLLMEQEIESNTTTIPVDHLTGSVFILQVIRRDIEIKAFKIFKTN
ncbi:MAG TPA: T9SS type A sorting domain-containing protein [Saprospiraceae bacterium]|jgi:type IX secretion system substrate protein